MPTRKTAGGQAAARGKAAAPKAKSGKGVASAEAAASGGGGQKPNALQQPLRASKELAAVVGTDPLPRGEVVSKVWDYIKKHQLQNPENRREILADATLEAVFGKKKVTMFEMNKHLAQHLK
jgi:chromatin remodeling complex protein RSC6